MFSNVANVLTRMPLRRDGSRGGRCSALFSGHFGAVLFRGLGGFFNITVKLRRDRGRQDRLERLRAIDRQRWDIAEARLTVPKRTS